MKLERFEEWFGVRNNHEDEEIWPGRLTYDPQEGITLKAINFSSPKLWYKNPSFEAETITGYLDYQRPATLIKPFIQASNPGSIGRYTSRIRASYNVVANGLLKNLHLVDIDNECFTGFNVQLPSFHAWMAPRLVRHDWDFGDDLPLPLISIERGQRQRLELKCGITLEIVLYPSISEVKEDIPIRQHTNCYVKFPRPVNYETALRLTFSFEMAFSFLIGRRLESAVYFLPTTTTNAWNGVTESIVAESWIVPTWKRDTDAPRPESRMFIAATSPIDTKEILDFVLQGSNEDLVYYMNMIMTIDMSDLRADDSFVEIAGCLEDFDKERFGSGRDPDKRRILRKIKRTIDIHGDDEERALCRTISGHLRNEYSLKQRLERLIRLWSEDGFRASPDVDRIVALRNLKPHGRGRDLSVEDFKHVITLLPFLSALFRYHILKQMGFDRNAIASGFARIPNHFGMFVPADLVPGGAGEQSQTAS